MAKHFLSGDCYPRASPNDTKNVRSYTLCDAATGATTDLGFTQPVSADRLASVDIMPLSNPVDQGYQHICLNDRHGEVLAQSLDGRVQIQFEDAEESDSPEWYDLTQYSYSWV